MTREQLAVFDLDGTLTRNDTYVAFLLHFLRRHPLRTLRTSSLPFAVAAHRFKLRDNTWLKARFLHRILGGSHRQVVQDAVDRYLSDLIASGLQPGALAAVETHRVSGDRLILASASFDFYVEPLATALGFDDVVCTRSAWHGDTLTGKLDGPNCYGQNKLALLQQALGLDEGAGITAYSDHHSDIPLLAWAERGVAVNPTPALSKAARTQGFAMADWSTASKGDDAMRPATAYRAGPR